MMGLTMPDHAFTMHNRCGVIRATILDSAGGPEDGAMRVEDFERGLAADAVAARAVYVALCRRFTDLPPWSIAARMGNVSARDFNAALSRSTGGGMSAQARAWFDSIMATTPADLPDWMPVGLRYRAEAAL